MIRSFEYVILGGGVAAGYAALEFVRRKGDAAPGELCIISDEDVRFLSLPAGDVKFMGNSDFVMFAGGTRLPAFHTCVGANDELLKAEWYKIHGVELILGTRVISADVRQKTLRTFHDETISYKTLIVATGAKALKLEEFRGSDAENVCYLRNIKDAEKLVGIMKSYPDGNAVVIGGGYIGMECAAALVANNIKVTMVFPEKYCMSRLFTPKLAEFYEELLHVKRSYFHQRNCSFVLGGLIFGKVTTAILRDHRRLPANLVVVGIGARANTELFEGQLAMERGGIKVNEQMQTSDASVYAVGDVAAFPVKLLGGDVRRLEHVDCARRTARHAVTAALSPAAAAAGDIDYLPFFYSRVFALSWRFYGDNAGEAVHFGDFSLSSSAPPKFGAFWVSQGRIAGAFLEGGTPEEYDAIATPCGVERRCRTWLSSRGRASRSL
ncbi:hypothetical protein PR202_ga02453 [Eleusine coracana subsp. coracana]|uniref:monodehydroascorbate reductase (NADH) n=1 Tax=Eleusine coracana subsp. coracana TaxID=191504 RepID=A0AAV5BKW9_ELECO|nr:hypothetical protein PR202_ga02453 [Eleusine coracana subsp. coracana]